MCVSVRNVIARVRIGTQTSNVRLHLLFKKHISIPLFNKCLTKTVSRNLKDTYIQMWSQQSKDSSRTCIITIFTNLTLVLNHILMTYLHAIESL